MLNAARRLAARGDWRALAGKIANAPEAGHPARAAFEAEVRALTEALAGAGDFRAGRHVREAHAVLRRHVAFMARDRAMDADVATVCALVSASRLAAGDNRSGANPA
jgi:histidine ammonia-lyase